MMIFLFCLSVKKGSMHWSSDRELSCVMLHAWTADAPSETFIPVVTRCWGSPSQSSQSAAESAELCWKSEQVKDDCREICLMSTLVKLKKKDGQIILHYRLAQKKNIICSVLKNDLSIHHSHIFPFHACCIPLAHFSVCPLILKTWYGACWSGHIWTGMLQLSVAFIRMSLAWGHFVDAWKDWNSNLLFPSVHTRLSSYSTHVPQTISKLPHALKPSVSGSHKDG